MATLGDRIKTMREKRQLSQRELAKRAGIDHAWIARLEAGERHNISLAAARRLAEVLQVSVDYLAGMYDDATTPPA